MNTNNTTTPDFIVDEDGTVTPAKLRSHPNRQDSTPRKRIQFFADSRSQDQLQTVRDWYETTTGQKLSTSLILRRGLDGLLEDLGTLTTKDALQGEVMRVVRLSGAVL